MAEFPALPLWTDAYLGDTTHLTTIEHGAYLLLLVAMWRSPDCALPDDDKMMARYAKLTAGQWARIKPVLMPFFRAADGQITQGRLTDERDAVRRKSNRQSDKAKARWLKDKGTVSAAAMPEPCRGDASLTLTHTHEKGDSNESPKKAPPRRATRLADDWFLPREWGEWAVGEGFDEARIRHEADQFSDYWRAASGQSATKRDWFATWRTWMRKVPKHKRKEAPNGGRSAATPRHSNRELYAKFDAIGADDIGGFGFDDFGSADDPWGNGPTSADNVVPLLASGAGYGGR